MGGLYRPDGGQNYRRLPSLCEASVFRCTRPMHSKSLPFGKEAEGPFFTAKVHKEALLMKQAGGAQQRGGCLLSK
eukprot:5114092-Amphidinium_carterae.1